jgi:MoxR-like ATPase
LLQCGKAFAFLDGRNFAIPEDIKAIFPGLARLRKTVPHGMENSVEEQITGLLNQVAIP